MQDVDGEPDDDIAAVGGGDFDGSVALAPACVARQHSGRKRANPVGPARWQKAHIQYFPSFVTVTV